MRAPMLEKFQKELSAAVKRLEFEAPGSPTSFPLVSIAMKAALFRACLILRDRRTGSEKTTTTDFSFGYASGLAKSSRTTEKSAKMSGKTGAVVKTRISNDEVL